MCDEKNDDPGIERFHHNKLLLNLFSLAPSDLPNIVISSVNFFNYIKV